MSTTVKRWRWCPVCGRPCPRATSGWLIAMVGPLTLGAFFYFLLGSLLK